MDQAKTESGCSSVPLEPPVGPTVDLVATARRIIRAGRSGRGVRLSSEETHALLFWNMPSTADDPIIGDGEC